MMQLVKGRPPSSGFSRSGKLWALQAATTTSIHAHALYEDGVYQDLCQVTQITLNPAWSGVVKDALEVVGVDNDKLPFLGEYGGLDEPGMCPWKCRGPFIISDWDANFVRLDSNKDASFWCELPVDILPKPWGSENV